jgi:hypothetical protein
MQRVTLVLLISIAALLPASVYGGGTTFTHRFDFGVALPDSASSAKAQGSLHLDAECGATAHGTLHLHRSDDAEPTVYEATSGDTSATCADTNGNGFAGLTGFTIAFVPVRGGANMATLYLSATTREIDERGWYPITLVIEGEGITSLSGEGTLLATGPFSFDDQTR